MPRLHTAHRLLITTIAAFSLTPAAGAQAESYRPVATCAQDGITIQSPEVAPPASEAAFHYRACYGSASDRIAVDLQQAVDGGYRTVGKAIVQRTQGATAPYSGSGVMPLPDVEGEYRLRARYYSIASEKPELTGYAPLTIAVPRLGDPPCAIKPWSPGDDDIHAPDDQAGNGPGCSNDYFPGEGDGSWPPLPQPPVQPETPVTPLPVPTTPEITSPERATETLKPVLLPAKLLLHTAVDPRKGGRKRISLTVSNVGGTTVRDVFYCLDRVPGNGWRVYSRPQATTTWVRTSRAICSQVEALAPGESARYGVTLRPAKGSRVPLTISTWAVGEGVARVSTKAAYSNDPKKP